MKNIKQILSYTSDMRNLFMIIGATSIIGALLGFVQPVIIKVATDWVAQILTGQAIFDWGMIYLIAGLVIIAAVVSAVIGDVGGYFGDQMAIRTRYQLSTRYFSHLLKLPQNYFDNEVTGKIINRLNRAITDITNFLQFFSNNLLQMLLTIVITLGVLAWYSWPLAILFALLIPANLLLTVKTSSSWQELEAAKNNHFDVASGRFAEVVGQMRLVKSFVTANQELKSFSTEMKKMLPLTARQSGQWHKMNAIRTGVFGVIQGAILGVLFYETARGQFSLGDMTMLLTLIAQVSFPIRNISFFVDTYQRAVANSRDYIEALAEQPEIIDDNLPDLKLSNVEVEFDKVNFSYGDKNEQVLYDISFKIKSGSKLALVGESGGGKTTISNLLMTLYRPTKGRVMIDGQDIAEVSRQSVRRSIATVFQDASLFSGTIRENIAYARPEASLDDIEAAAKASNAHDFIAKLPNGYDTEIGERGIKLSGGQKQRVAIARAILKDAPILILDEATSSLDSRAEHEVQEALDRLMEGRTVLIIAHRLSTIAGVDTIVTLKNGHVDEVGSPSELAQTDGIYAQLLKLQLGTTESTKKRLAKFDITG